MAQLGASSFAKSDCGFRSSRKTTRFGHIARCHAGQVGLARAPFSGGLVSWAKQAPTCAETGVLFLKPPNPKQALLALVFLVVGGGGGSDS